MRETGSPAVLRALLLAAAATAFLSCTRETASRPDADVVVAVVNGTSFSLRDLKREILSQRGFAPSLDVKGAGRDEVSSAIRRIVEKTVVTQEGQRQGIKVDTADVENEISRLRQDFPPGGLEKVLAKEGIDSEAWREELRGALLYRKSAAAIAAGRAEVSQAEVEAAFRKAERRSALPERIRVRQILFDSEEKARKGRERIAAGQDPEEIARQLSDEDSSPVVVDMGFFARDEIPRGLPEELFGLAEGGVSAVVTQEDTFSLFQVVKREAARTPSLADAAPGIREELLRARREEAFRQWLTAEVGKASVRIQQALLDKFVEGAK